MTIKLFQFCKFVGGNASSRQSHLLAEVRYLSWLHSYATHDSASLSQLLNDTWKLISSHTI